MSDQDGKIDGSNGSSSRKMFGANLRMIREIRDQKQNRSAKSDDHTDFVGSNIPGTNEEVSGNQKDCARGIQNRIQRR